MSIIFFKTLYVNKNCLNGAATLKKMLYIFYEPAKINNISTTV